MTQEFTMPDVSPVQSLTAFFEALTESSILINNDAPKYTILAASPAYITMIGIAKDNLIGKGMFEAFPPNPDDPSDTGSNDVRASLEMVRLHKKPHQLPVQRYDVAGEDGYLVERYWRAINKPVFALGGEVAYIIHTAEDITDQVKAGVKEQEHQELVKAYNIIEKSQAALMESEAKYRNLFESMGQAYCTIETLFNEEGTCIDYQYVEVNPAFERQSGLTNAVGKTIRELAPDIESFWFDFFGNVAQTGKPNRITDESRALQKWFEIYAIRIGGPESNYVGVFFTDVTESKQSEGLIKASERNLRNTILQAPVAICIFRGPQFVVEIANDKMYELWGRGKEEVMGKSIFVGVPEVSNQGYEELLMGVYTTGERFTANGTPVTVPRNGSIETIYINLLYEAFREPDGSISGIIAVAIDVTEQVEARKKLEESEVRFRSMADITPVLITVGDETGNIKYYNKAWSDLTGRPMDVLLHSDWTELIATEDKERFVAVFLDAFAIKAPFTGEFRVQNTKGESRWLLAHGVPRFNVDNNFVGYIAACSDITELKISQQQLQTALEQVRLSKEAAELGTFDLDLKKGTMHWDDRCRTLFGISHNEAVTYEKDFVGGLHPDDRERILQVIDQSFIKAVGNGDYDVEYRTVGAENGTVRWVRAKGKVYFNQQDKPVRFIGSVLDITDQVNAVQKIERLVEDRTKELAQANESLIRTNQELQRSNTNLEEFAHAASHDMKEPIRKILTFSDRLKRSLEPRMTEVEKDLFSRVENSTQRMGLLVDDLLEFSHVSERPMDTEVVNLKVKVEKVLTDLELLIEEKKAQVNVGTLPTVKGYKRQLQQLLQNLIGNALKYSKPDVAPVVTITSQEILGKEAVDRVLPEQLEQRFYLIEVKDNGIGFEPEYAEKIFQMFQRLHGKAEYPGTGVGLSIARKVVENHNGYIWAESQPGEGATFKVLLPASGLAVSDCIM